MSTKIVTARRLKIMINKTSLRKKLTTKDKKPLKFVIVGISNTVVDFLIMNILKFMGVNLIIANTISTGTAMVYSFFMNKKWTFRNAGKDYFRQVVLFFVFTIIGIWIIQNSFIWLIDKYVPTFGLPEQLFANLAKLAASVPSLIWNYITYNKIVFKNNDTRDNESIDSKRDNHREEK